MRVRIEKSHLALTWLLCLLALTFTAPVAQGYHFPWDQGHDTTDWDDPSPPGPCEGGVCDSCSGNASRSPVYTATGHFVWSDTDVALNGRPSIGITRTYNSHDPRAGIFGNGWTVGCELALYKATRFEDDATIYTLRVGNGKRYEFIQLLGGDPTPPPGRYETLQPQADGTVQFIHPDGSVKIFRKDGKLSRELDRNSNATEYSYNSSGMLTMIADAHGRAIALAYNSAGRVASVADHTGRIWRYTYDLDGNLERVTDALGGVRRYSYEGYQPTGDAHIYQHLTSIVDASGVEVVRVTYNMERVASYTEGANTFRYTYDTVNNRVTKTDAMNSVWLFTYNADGLIIQDTDPLGNIWRQEFDADGNVTRRIDSLGHASEWTYDDQGRRLTFKNPLGDTETYAYQGTNPQPIRTTSPSGRVTEITYDARQNPLTVKDPAGGVTRFEWNSTGDLVATIDAMGNRSEMTYTPAGLLETVKDPLARVTTYTYDGRGNLVEQVNPARERVQYFYDSLDRRVQTTDPLGGTTAYTYDAAGRLLSLTDPAGNTTSYSYDNNGRMETRRSPDARIWKYAYRADNLVSELTLPDNRKFTYTYDVAKRMTSEDAAGLISTFAYSARGELTGATSPTDEIASAYDAAGRMVRETVNGEQVTSTYNSDGERTRLAALGTAIDYTYDQRGLLKSIADAGETFDFTRDALGRRTRLSYPTGATANYSYDPAGRLASLTHSGAFAASYVYTYDTAGRMTRLAGDGADWIYQYDNHGRLTQAAHGADSFTYPMDAVGNILVGGRQYDAANRLAQDDDHVFTYDALGNLTEKRNRTTGARDVFIWNAKSHLIRFEHYPDGTAASPSLSIVYSYDALGRRSSRSKNGTTEKFIYDGPARIGVVGELGQAQVYVIFSDHIDEPLRESGQGTYRHFHSNHLGSIVGVTDSAVVLAKLAYDPYGATETVGSTGVDFRYTGREQDAEDLYYYRARYYDPSIQRFLSEDPVGFQGGINFYAYVNNNPISLVDPSGLCSCGLPSGSDFWSRYPNYNDYSGSDVWNLIGGSLNDKYGANSPGGLQNSCAVRVSYGLNRSGRPIPRGAPGANRNYGGDNARYILSARELNSYLRSAYGAPSRTLMSTGQFNAFQQGLSAGQVAIVSSKGHAAVVTGSYADPYVRSYLGDVWILPTTGRCTCR